jgi:hypothetical protein
MLEKRLKDTGISLLTTGFPFVVSGAIIESTHNVTTAGATNIAFLLGGIAAWIVGAIIWGFSKQLSELFSKPS